MAPTPASQTAFHWNNAAVEELEGIDPSWDFESPDTTKMSDAATVVTPTVQNPTISVTFKRDTAATVQNAMLADFLAKTARAWKVYDATAKYFSGTSYIKSWKPGPQIKGFQTVTITIEGTSNGTAVSYT